MGSPKALLTLDGETFLARLVTALAGGGCEPILVVTGPEDERDAARTADEARSLGALVAVNPDRGSEQIASLRAALRVLPGELQAVVTTPVDSPGATAPVVRALIEAAAAGAPIALVTHAGRRGHPVLFGRSVFAELLSEDLPEGARTVIHRHEARLVEIEVEESDVLLDVDTPGEYERLKRERG
jgi:CTP:molybdopterin cytidylyltransferase MocA